MNLPPFLLQNPQVLLRKMIRVGAFLVGALLVLMFLKYKHDQNEKKLAEEAEKHRQDDLALQAHEEVNWEERFRAVVPEQELLLTPNVVPQLLLPPLLDKIDVPKALVYERKQRYIAAFELSQLASVKLWTAPAAAAPLDMRVPAFGRDVPAMTPPLSSAATKPREPKPYRGIEPTFIRLP